MRSGPDADRLHALTRHAVDAVAFQALKAGARWWVDAPSRDGGADAAATGAMLAYVPAGRSWIAIGTPLTDVEKRAEAVRRFVAAARAHRRRPVFFGIEDRTPFEGCRTLVLGLQSVLRPSEWQATLRRRPKLREQLRRARAKGVTVRSVDHEELTGSASLRRNVDRLAREWLASRPMEPMTFLLRVDPLRAAAEHLYFVAERNGAAVQFLSAVPIYARNGWLMEDMLRGTAAPNGTSELLIDAIMRRVDESSPWLTPGLTPLTGPIAWWLRVTRFATVALYDFTGLRRFRARLRPADWRPVWLAWDRGPAIGVLVDVLRAFSGGRLLPFAIRSLVRHPGGPPWAVAVPLVGWTVFLMGLVLAGDTRTLGYPLSSLLRWVVFDLVLVWLLFTVARRPRWRPLMAVAVVALADAVLSARHFTAVGLGDGVFSGVCRVIARAGPVIGTGALVWASWLALRAPTFSRK